MLFPSFFLLLSLTTLLNSISLLSSPYLSPTTFLPDYQNMLLNFKIFIYKPNAALTYNSPQETLFYTSLRNSPFVTQNAEEAHLFFIPFSSDLSTTAVERVVKGLRTELPYWNRALGADHVFLSCSGLRAGSDRTIVELNKNSVQISCFPTRAGMLIPHKDITLPPLATLHAPIRNTTSVLGYFRDRGAKESSLAKELSDDPDFLVESEPSDEITYADRLSRSKFCLFDNGIDVSGIGEALRFGCVPVVIADRPMQDLPFMDVLRWQEIAVFVGSGGGAKELKLELTRAGGEGYERIKILGVEASRHFVWNESPQPLDCFNTVMYQLWLRRHAIRYVTRE
ncbi:hypothetical protein UlMin_025579 [Ulmus minor]